MFTASPAVTLGSQPVRFVRLVRGVWVPGARKWLTTAQVAELLRVEPITVWRYANAGDLEFEKTPGGHRRFDPDVVDAFIRKVRAEQKRRGAE